MSMKNIRKMAFAILKDESGQSTTEYVLLLVFVVVAVKSVGTRLKDGLNSLIGQAMGKADEAVSKVQTE